MYINGSEVIDQACVRLIRLVDNSGATIHNNPVTQLANGNRFPAWFILTRNQNFEDEIGAMGIFSEEKEIYYYISKDQIDPRIFDKYRAMQFKLMEFGEYLSLDDENPQDKDIKINERSFEVSRECLKMSFKVAFRVSKKGLPIWMQSATIITTAK